MSKANAVHKANVAHIQKSLFGQKGTASRASNPLSYGSKTAASMIGKNSSMAVKDEQNESNDMATYSSKIPISSNRGEGRQQSSSSKNVVQGPSRLHVKSQLRKNQALSSQNIDDKAQTQYRIMSNDG